MNTRTVHKRLYRQRRMVFWGPRAYAEIRISPSIFAVSPPKLPTLPEGFHGGFLGSYYDHKDDEKALRMIHIGHPSCGVHPDQLDDPDLFVVPGTVSGDDESGYQWWECWTASRDNPDASFENHAPFFDHPWVKEHIAYTEWVGQAYYDWKHPILARLQQTHNWSKSMDISLDPDGYVHFTYGVKYFYPETLRRFSAAFSRAFKAAKKAGLDVQAHI
jgi:hypothetical protein